MFVCRQNNTVMNPAAYKQTNKIRPMKVIIRKLVRIGKNIQKSYSRVLMPISDLIQNRKKFILTI